MTAQESDDPYEKSAEYWRQLAQKAFVETQLTTDPRVREVLLNITSEYLSLAKQVEEPAGRG